MQTVNIHEAKTHLSKLLELVATGQEIIIAKANRPIARLMPLEIQRKPRQPDMLQGQIKISDDFDAPLPESMASAFRGE